MDSIQSYVPSDWNGVLLVGEYPYEKDFASGIPFRGGYGVELQSSLAKVGIVLKECAAMYVYRKAVRGDNIDFLIKYTKTAVNKGEAVEFEKAFVSEEYVKCVEALRWEIDKLKPKFIITLGELALRGVLGEKGIDDFRGSMEYYKGIPCMPTHSMARVYKQTHLRFIVASDFAKVRKHFKEGWPEPDWKILINPSFPEVMERLQILIDKMSLGPVEIGVDLETRKRFYIGVAGVAWSETEAIAIPFIRPNWKPYWSEEEEIKIVLKLKELLEHPNAKVAGQNYHYDAQYMARHWGVRSHIWIDTMCAHHTCFSADFPKALHVLSSVYCEYHQYWKDESHGEEDDKWEPTEASWDNYLLYNGKDCCKTLDVARVLDRDVIPQMGMDVPWQFQKSMWPLLLKVMLRGNKYDWEERNEQRRALEVRMKVLEEFIETCVPEDVYPRWKKASFYTSPIQLAELFYKVLAIPVVTKRNPAGIHVPTTEDDALQIVAMREPIVKPLCEAILAYRSMKVSYNTFLTPYPDYDDYMRSMYKLAGTGTYRLASCGDVFDFGLNLQNLSKGK